MSVKTEKEACQDLYSQYNDLLKKVQMRIKVLGIKTGTPTYIRANDMLQKAEIRQKLFDCKTYLNLKPRELFKIQKR